MTPVNLLSNVTHNNNSTHSTRMVHIRLPEHHVRALKIHAATIDSSVTRLVEAAVQQQYFTEQSDVEPQPTPPSKNSAEAPTPPTSKTAETNGKPKPAKTSPKPVKAKSKAKAKPPTTGAGPSRPPRDQGGDVDGADLRIANVMSNPFAAG